MVKVKGGILAPFPVDGGELFDYLHGKETDWAKTKELMRKFDGIETEQEKDDRLSHFTEGTIYEIVGPCPTPR